MKSEELKGKEEEESRPRMGTGVRDRRGQFAPWQTRFYCEPSDRPDRRVVFCGRGRRLLVIVSGAKSLAGNSSHGNSSSNQITSASISHL